MIGSVLVPCVLIPTSDNPRTVAGVVRGALERCPRVVLVDDGSGPEARAAIDEVAALEGVTLVRHAANQGKGAALRSGFARALELGCTHALSVDADGQHPLEEIPRFLQRAAERPEALLIGWRDLQAAGASRGSTWGRANSNFWTWVETGLRLPDTQSGFRCYPLNAVSTLALRRTGYDLEIEVLVRLAWTGTPVESLPIPVRYFQGAERVSHMRPFRDFVRVGRLNTRLVAARICLPSPVLDLISRDTWRRSRLRDRLGVMWRVLAHEPGTPERAAASVALGLFMGIAPVWGLQMTLALLVAHLLNLSKPLAVVATNVSFPLMIPVIGWLSVLMGRLTLDPTAPRAQLMSFAVGPGDLPRYFVGSLLLAGTAAFVGAALTWILVSGARWLRRRSGDPDAVGAGKPIA